MRVRECSILAVLLISTSCRNSGSEIAPSPEGILAAETKVSADFWSDRLYPEYFMKYTDPNPPACVELAGSMQTRERSVIRVLGFDAVSWQILNVLLKTNELPNLKALASVGTSAILETDWADSPVSWTTIATGKSMEKHGILTIHQTGQSAFNYPIDAVRIARIWDIFRYHGRSTKIGHFFFTEQRMPNMRTMKEQCTEIRDKIKSSEAETLITIIDITDMQFHRSLLPYIMRQTDWSKELEITPTCRWWIDHHADKIVEVLGEMDRFIGEVHQQYPQDTLVLLSDHGQSVKIPRIYITLEPRKLWRFSKVSGPEFNEIVTLESGLQIHLETRPRYIKIAADQHHDFAVTVYTVHVTINPPAGCPPEAIAALEDRLSQLTTGGRNILQKTGDGFDLNPALIEIVMKDGLDDPAVREAFIIGDHDKNDAGFFMAYGPAIRSGYTAKPLRLVDVVPTLLYLAGMPVGRDMDGQVAMDIFRGEFSKDNPIRFIDSYEPLVKLAPIKTEERALTPEEREKYRQVGYPGIN